jgi:hypothetical protein
MAAQYTEARAGGRGSEGEAVELRVMLGLTTSRELRRVHEWLDHGRLS